MSIYVTSDKEQIFYRDWGAGQPIVFSHGWPLSADAWDDQMLFLSSQGFRCISFDRRGYGRSSQPWNGNDMDTYADDLAGLTNYLDLHSVVHVGHSAGAGEIVRYIARHGSDRVAKVAFIAGVPPVMVKTASNPGGQPIEIFDQVRADVRKDRSQFLRDLSAWYYNADRPGSKVPQGLRDSFWLQGMLAGYRAFYDFIKVMSETDFSSDLTKVDVPTLFIHGDDDQIVPIADSSMLAVKLVKGATLRVIPGGSHGVCSTHKDLISQELLTFARP